MKVTNRGRIIIGLRPLPQAEASIAAAIRLAAALEAEAVGMFIQDESLMNFAGLPFSGGLDTYGKPIESVSPGSMLREFNRMEKRWQQLLSEQAAKASVSSSFVSQRGEFLNIIKSVLVSGDYLVVSAGGSEFEARQLLDQIEAMPSGISGVVIVPRTIVEREHAPVIALLDGDKAAKKIVPLAARLAQLTDGSLEVMAHTETQAELANRLAEIQQLIPRKLPVNYLPQASDSVESVVAAVQKISPAFVVVDLNDAMFHEVRSMALLCRAASAPIVMLRSDRAD